MILKSNLNQISRLKKRSILDDVLQSFISKNIDRIEHDENTIFCNFVGIN